MAGAAAGGARRVSEDDRRRYVAREAPPSTPRRPSGVRGDNAEPQHHDVSLRAAGPEASVWIWEGRELSESVESEPADCSGEKRRRLSVQRAHRRQICVKG